MANQLALRFGFAARIREAHSRESAEPKGVHPGQEAWSSSRCPRSWEKGGLRPTLESHAQAVKTINDPFSGAGQLLIMAS